MAYELLMPQLGLTMEEGTVSKWLKHEGEAVKVGEAVVEITTDKLTNEVVSQWDGVLLKIAAQEECDVPVKGLLAYIGNAGEIIGGVAAPAAAPEKPAEDVRVTVIGGGPGGYVAAIRAAQLGAKVTLIEKAEMGGTCLNRGCMPTKAMLHTSEIYEQAIHSADIGIIGEKVSVDWTKVQAFRASVVAKLTSGVKALCKANKVSVINGEAVFTGPKTVSVGGKEYDADRVIIASGSFPLIPGIPGLKESRAMLDSTAGLSLDHIPQSLLVIGGGVIGLELGSVYMRYGAKVTVVEMLPKLLPLMDGELTAILEQKLRGQGMEILTSSRVVGVQDTASGAVISVRTPSGERRIEAEKILVGAGRVPDTASLALDKAGIACSSKGFIETDDRMETCVPGVFAIGDCCGKLMFAHAAMVMGETAAENAMGGCAVFDPDLSPSCAYVGPEFAGVGLTEEKAKELGIAYKLGCFPTAGNGRSLVDGNTDGMVKILAGQQYGEILGVHILAPNATELIEEASLAIKLEATLDELSETIHCHPTVSEALRECALAADGKAIHIPNKKSSPSSVSPSSRA